MGDFWKTLSTCEGSGWDFIKNNSWQIDTYDVILILNPKEHSIEVNGNAIGTVLAESCEELRFLLGLNTSSESYAQVAIKALSVNGQQGVDYMSDQYKFRIPLLQKAYRGDRVTLGFHYTSVPLARKCWVNSDSKGPVEGLGDGETELCFEGFWLPFANEQYQQVMATVEIVDRAGCQVVFNGELLKTWQEGGAPYSKYGTTVPTLPTIVAGEFEKTTSMLGDGGSITFYHQKEYAKVAEDIVDFTQGILERFVEWFTVNPVRNFYLVQLKRTEWGQYAPFPMVIFPRDDISQEMERGSWERLAGMLGHEIAHFWFGGLLSSDPNEQWLSEGFAQYMNLLTVETLYGDERLHKNLQQYLKALHDIQDEPQAPLCDIPLRHPLQHMLVRTKGAIVLHCLRQTLGLDKFLKELVTGYHGERITTDTVEGLCHELFPQLDSKSFFDIHLRGTAKYEWDDKERIIRVAT
jgi:hypothetical protein